MDALLRLKIVYEFTSGAYHDIVHRNAQQALKATDPSPEDLASGSDAREALRVRRISPRRARPRRSNEKGRNHLALAQSPLFELERNLTLPAHRTRIDAAGSSRTRLRR